MTKAEHKTGGKDWEVYSRNQFFEKARQMISECEAGFYVLSCVNIDNFKVINAQYGTQTGDNVICHVSATMAKHMAEVGGICAHIAADEFAALYPRVCSASDKMSDAYDKASTPDCIFQRIRLRVGRCVIDDTALSVDTLYDSAKLAADAIRNNYERDIEYYKDYMRTNLVKRQQVIYEMRDALASGQFEPWFQPQYNHATGALIGAEVLVRWKKDGKFIPPSEFIPIFEQNGFIYELDKYIWERSCALLRKWIDSGKEPLPISVNVSRRDILHKSFIPFVTELINKYRLHNDLIRFEITESAFAESATEINEKVKELINLGFIVEIDDFGSGYSSLNTLKDIPASVLKLDMRFFENSADSQRAGNIIESVIRMAKWLGMAVIAEGVEDKRLADYLKSIGCYYIQGYFYAKPMPVDIYERLLDVSDKEHKLSRLKTLETFDSNEFWNPKSMDTLIFNSYVGGTCIFEYHNGRTHILRLNDQYIQQFGGIIPPGTELHGAAVSKYMNESDRAVFFDTIDKAVSTHKEASCEVKIANGNQTEYIRVTVRTLARTDDRILCYGVAVNMTEQRMAEINERNVVAQLDTMMRSIHASVTATIFKDRNNFTVLYKNNGFYQMYGYTKEQYAKEVENVNDLILPEDYAKAMDAVERVVRTGQSETHDFRCKRRDGSIVWVQITNSVVNLDGIGKNILIGVSMDVTDIHNLRMTEESAADKLRAVLDSVSNGITAAYTEGDKVNFIIANDKFYKIHGIERSDDICVSLKQLMELTHTENSQMISDAVASAITTGEDREIVYRIVRNGGETAWIKANVSTTHISGIEPPVQITVFSDITAEIEYINKLHIDLQGS